MDKVAFLEEFVLSDNKAKVLEKLLPNSHEHLYYSILLEQLNNPASASRREERLMKQLQEHFSQHHKHYALFNLRRKLLSYGKNKNSVCNYLRDEILGLRFDHVKKTTIRRTGEPASSSAPTRLDPAMVDPERLMRAEFDKQHFSTLTEAALPWLLGQRIKSRNLDEVLDRLPHAGYPRVMSHLKTLAGRDKPKPSFDNLPLTADLTLAQLEELGSSASHLRADSDYCTAVLARLQPAPDVDLARDGEVQRAYVARVRAFAARLPPVLNSLRFGLFAACLAFDIRQGELSEARLVELLQIPNRVLRIAPSFIEPFQSNRERRSHIVTRATAPVNRDVLPAPDTVAMVHEALLELLKDRESAAPFEQYLDPEYLERTLAEAKILHGTGDLTRWHAEFKDPALLARLRDRVELSFAPMRTTVYGPDDEVVLPVTVKNIAALRVSVFEINTEAFYRREGTEVGTSIDLDGLVARERQQHTYDHAPHRRHVETFAFPSLAGRRGVYVIEFIGGGVRSRAVIQKGALRYVDRCTEAGQLVMVLDEQNRHLPDAALWLGDREFTRNPDLPGILIPYTATPGAAKIVLTHAGFAALHTLQHRSEEYTFHAGIFVDRESLLRFHVARAVLRPSLQLCGVAVPLALLEDPVVTLSIKTSGEGVPTTKQFRDLTLNDDAELAVELRVPDQLREISVRIEAKVRVVSQNDRRLDVSASKSFRVNANDATDRLLAAHLVPDASGYRLLVLGKSGEPAAQLPVALDLASRYVDRRVHASLQTDAQGTVQLGQLPGITRLGCRIQLGSSAQSFSWDLAAADLACDVPGTLAHPAGAVLRVPYRGTREQATHASLTELNCAGIPVADHSNKMRFADGFLLIAGELPPGHYTLRCPHTAINTALHILPSAAAIPGFLCSPSRAVEHLASPPHLVDTAADANALVLQLANCTESTRVHVFATHFYPAVHAQHCLSRDLREPEAYTFPHAAAAFEAENALGEEQRYVIDRQSAPSRVGNMLPRPQLLLNPWAVQSTATTIHSAAGGAAFRGERAEMHRSRHRSSGKRGTKGARAQPTGEASLDFLAHASHTEINIRPAPGPRSEVRIPREALRPGQACVCVVVADREALLTRIIRLPPVPPAAPLYNDMRLLAGFDPARHWAEQKEATCLVPGTDLMASRAEQPGAQITAFAAPREVQAELRIDDMATASYEAYDTLKKAYDLLVTLSEGRASAAGPPAAATLREMHFLPRWAALTRKEKLDYYSQYACHELEFFIYQKDPALFNEAILPFIANRMEKDFLDDYLLGRDLGRYFALDERARLNTLELILLAAWARARSDSEPFATYNSLQSQCDARPANRDRDNVLFKAALQAFAMEADGADQLRALAAQPPPPPPPSAPSVSATFGMAPGIPMPAPMMCATASAHKRRSRRSPPGRPEPREECMREEECLMQDESCCLELCDMAPTPMPKASLMAARKAAPQLFQAPETTQEYAETYYYKVRRGASHALVPINEFWADYAAHVLRGDPNTPFLSGHLVRCAETFASGALALALLDLPFAAPEHGFDFRTQGGATTLELRAGGPMVVFHKEIRPCAAPGERAPILVQQSIIDPSDRTRYEAGEQVTKYATGELAPSHPYVCEVILSNTSARSYQLDVLVQIPTGAVPIRDGQTSKSHTIHVPARHTHVLEYAFYFPRCGEFAQFPAQVAYGGHVIAAPLSLPALRVVECPACEDAASWTELAQHGTDDQLLAFLDAENLHRPDVCLDDILWRLKSRALFLRVTETLRRRHMYHQGVWSYSMHHNAPDRMAEYLPKVLPLKRRLPLASEICTYDPVAAGELAHLEYRPLINARAHQLGERREILNTRLRTQYRRVLRYLAHKPLLAAADRLALVYYLLLQDRVEEAQSLFARVGPEEARMEHLELQHDYLAAYLDFYSDAHGAPLAVAREMATKHAEHPVPKWQRMFGEIARQLQEIDGEEVAPLDDGSTMADTETERELLRARRQTERAKAAPSLELAVDTEGKALRITHAHLPAGRAAVRYYLMDTELLFSAQPFLAQAGERFAYVQPNAEHTVDLGTGAETQERVVPIPEELRSANAFIEVACDGLQRTGVYSSSALAVQVFENYGQLKVTRCEDGRPLSKVYVKAYARIGGAAQFYKDGYTDLRGRFDYASLSTDELSRTERFALLIISPTHGAIIREAAPPKQ